MPDADLILTNGFVYTVDGRRSVARAVVVRGSRIAVVGADHDALAHRGPRTTVVDLGGRLVLPGFIDAHMHPGLGALSDLYEPSLRGARSVDECLELEPRRIAGSRVLLTLFRGAPVYAQSPLEDLLQKPAAPAIDTGMGRGEGPP